VLGEDHAVTDHARTVRRLAGTAAVSLVLMLAGCLFMWAGVPLLWLWVARNRASSEVTPLVVNQGLSYQNSTVPPALTVTSNVV
jgi:hypothetical protein